MRMSNATPSESQLTNGRGSQMMKNEMARVVVVGTSCMGKTTFSRRLAQLYRIPHIELDALHWLPNWVSRPPDEFSSLVKEAVAQENWVVDGNYNPVRPLVWSRATTVIWLNYAFPTVLWRALSRTVRRSLTREELYSGNRESLRLAFFSRDSILLWVLKTFHQCRVGYRNLFADPQWRHLTRIELRKPSEADEFLRLSTMRTITNSCEAAAKDLP
jgi:adenylate kinase family enzyme